MTSDVQVDEELSALKASFELRVMQRTEELRQSEQLHRMAFDLAPAGMAFVGLDQRFTKVNETMCEITGYSADELVGKKCTDLIFPDDLKRDAELLAAFQRGSTTKYVNEKRYVRKDGSIRWVAMLASMVTDADARPLHSIRVVRDITDYRQTTESLRLASAAMEAAANGIFITDREGTINYINPAFTTISGYEAADAVGKKASLIRSGEHQEDFYRDLWQTILAGEVWRGETTNRHKDGYLYVSEQTIAPERNADGEIAHFVSIQQDVTQRKQAEEQVRISEVRYRRLFEAAHDGVLLLDPATCRITDANPFMTTLLSYSRDQLVGKELFEIGLLKDEAASREMFEKLKKDRQVRYDDLPLESQEGRHQEVEVVANVYDEDGHTVIQCNIRDITARKQAELAVLQLAAIVQFSDDAIIGKDLNSIISSWNRGAEKVFGYTEAEMVGTSIMRLIPADRQCDEDMILTAIKRGKSVQHFETRRQTKDGRLIHVSVTASPIKDAAGQVIGVSKVARDITARKQAEAAQHRLTVLTASNEKLEQSILHRQVVEESLRQSEQHQKQLVEQSREMQAQLRQLSREVLQAQEEERKRISRELHDVIAQTLTGINMRLSLLQSETNASTKDLHEKIAQTQRMVEQSVDTVHRFARDLRPAMLDDLGLIPALRTYLKEFTQQTGIAVELKVEAGIEDLDSAGRTVLYRIAQEALTNVVRHAKASLVVVNLRKAGVIHCMEVRDNGQGFELGGTSKGNRLGLLGMRERVEMIGGTFQMESTPGKGTTIRVEIPSQSLSPKNECI